MKVLIMTLQPSYCIGGLEKYNKKTEQIIQCKFPSSEIEEFLLAPDVQFVNDHDKKYYQAKIFWKSKFMGYWIFFNRSRKLLNEILKTKNYDLTINLTSFDPGIKIMQSAHYAWVQNGDVHAY